MKPNIVCVGLDEFKDCFLDDYEVDFADTLDSARELLKTKAYDSAVIRFNLGKDKGNTFTQYYPHYRTILIVEDEKEYKEYLKVKNGVYKVIIDFDEAQVLNALKQLISSSEKSGQEDPMVILLNINKSLEEVTMEVNFLQTNISDIHTALEKLNLSQKALTKTFEQYKDNKMRSDQFFLTNIAQIEKKVDDVQQKFRKSDK